MNKLIGVSYIGIITGAVAGMVYAYNSPSWWLPFVVCGMFSIPAYLGYRAGKDGE